MNLDIHELKNDGRAVIVVGTRVVTPEAVAQLQQLIESHAPSAVVLDYDETRWRWLGRLRDGEEFDLVDVLKSGEMSELNARLAHGVAGKYEAPRCDVPEDDEFRLAAVAAERVGAAVVFGRRKVEIEGVRAWRTISLGERLGLALRLVVGSLKRATVDREDLDEAIASFDPIEARRSTLERARNAAHVTIDEAQAWLARVMADTAGDIVVVTRAANIDGLMAHMKLDNDVSDMEVVPPKSLISRVLPWAFSAAIVGAFILGFVFADTDKMMGAVTIWVVVNMIASAIGAAAALAHPLAILATSLSAPFVSLNPAVGAGMVGAVAQAFVAPPPVRDMDMVGDDIAEIKGWWRNRLSRLLLIFIFANVASSIGSFIALGLIPTD